MFAIDCGDIFLREFQLEDAEKICSIAQEDDIVRFLPDWQTSKEQRLEWLRDYEIVDNQKFLKAVAEAKDIMDYRLKLGIFLKKTNEFIGWCCTIVKDELPAPNREINYAISEKYCKRGYATKAVKGLVNFLFNKANVNQLIAIALIENIASNKVIKKCGFKYSGEVKLDNEIYNNYKLTKKDWNKSYG